MIIDGLVQDCSTSCVLAMELLQSCTKPTILSRLNLSLGKINPLLSCIVNTMDNNDQGPVLLQQSDAVARIPANGSAAFNESCTPIG